MEEINKLKIYLDDFYQKECIPTEICTLHSVLHANALIQLDTIIEHSKSFCLDYLNKLRRRYFNYNINFNYIFNIFDFLDIKLLINREVIRLQELAKVINTDYIRVILIDLNSLHDFWRHDSFYPLLNLLLQISRSLGFFVLLVIDDIIYQSEFPYKNLIDSFVKNYYVIGRKENSENSPASFILKKAESL